MPPKLVAPIRSKSDRCVALFVQAYLSSDSRQIINGGFMVFVLDEQLRSVDLVLGSFWGSPAPASSVLNLFSNSYAQNGDI